MIKHRKGFTLIELLVVITIIAVLAAILFPVFLMARAKARSVGCISNLKQFGNLFSMYQGDYDQRFPYTSYPMGGPGAEGTTPDRLLPEGHPNWRGSISEVWTAKLEPYVGYDLIYNYEPQGILRCRASDRAWNVASPGAGPVANRRDSVGYGYNFLYLGLPWHAKDGGANPYFRNDFSHGTPRITYLKKADSTVLLVENATLWAFPPFMANGDSGYEGNKYIRPRHGMTDTNVLWCDGSVSVVDTQQLVLRNLPFGDYDEDSGRPREHRGVAIDNSLWDIE